MFSCSTPNISDRGEGTSNKGRYGCVASAKPRPGKISPENLMPGQKMPKNPMIGQVFMDFRDSKFEILSKIAKNLMSGQNLAPKT